MFSNSQGISQQTTQNRRHILSLLTLPFVVACANGLGRNSTSPMAQVVPFVKKEIVWKSNNFFDFLASLPPSGLLALKKSLELLPYEATETALKGTQVDLLEINTSLCEKTSWFGICRNPSEFDYHGMVVGLAKQANVDPVKLLNSPTFEVEQLLMEKVVTAIEKDFIAKWEKMTLQERKLVLDRVDPNGKLKDHAAVAAEAGGAVIRLFAVAVGMTGFASYVFATTALSLVAKMVSLTLPFTAYTSLTTVMAAVVGPIGIFVSVLASVFGVIWFNRPDEKKMASFALTVFALKMDALSTNQN